MARAYTGFAGDTLASALLANGMHLLGRSFKYHRPRGVLAAGAEEPNALVAVRRDAARYTPNLRATQVELYEGLEAHSQNRWPSLAFDVGAVNDLIAPFIPAGFYYKTFMWPRRAWHALYEPRIRAAAGLGRAPTQADPDRYAARYAHCDVLVVGAGPAGLAAAAAAAALGARVMLCDEQPQFGGSLLADNPQSAPPIEGRSASEWLTLTLATLAARAQVTLLPRTTAFGYFPHNLVALNERLTDHLAHPDPDLPRERQWQVRAREVVLATGAIERPLVFPGQRSARDHAGRRSAYLAQSLRGARRLARRGHHRSRRRLTRRHSSCSRRACSSPPLPMCAPPRAAPGRRAPARPAFRCMTAATVLAHQRTAAGEFHRARHTRGRRASAQACCMPCDAGADVRRAHPECASVLAVARQPALGSGSCRRSCRAHRRSACAAPVPAAASMRCAAALADGAAAGAAAAREATDPARRGVCPAPRSSAPRRTRTRDRCG